MGGFSIWHWIILFGTLAVPVFIGLMIWLIVRATRKPTALSRPTGPLAAQSSQASSAEARLRELDSLRSKGLITDLEYEQRRSSILSDI